MATVERACETSSVYSCKHRFPVRPCQHPGGLQARSVCAEQSGAWAPPCWSPGCPRWGRVTRIPLRLHTSEHTKQRCVFEILISGRARTGSRSSYQRIVTACSGEMVGGSTVRCLFSRVLGNSGMFLNVVWLSPIPQHSPLVSRKFGKDLFT